MHYLESCGTITSCKEGKISFKACPIEIRIPSTVTESNNDFWTVFSGFKHIRHLMTGKFNNHTDTQKLKYYNN